MKHCPLLAVYNSSKELVAQEIVGYPVACWWRPLKKIVIDRNKNMITKMFPMPLAKPSLAVSMLVPVLLLSGCGGSESDNADGSANAPVVEQAPVSARDGFNVVTPDAPGYVDLSSLIESGTAGAKVTSVYLESKQGTGDCGQVLSSSEASGDSSNANVILGQGFNVTIDGAAICEYTYEVESVALAGQTKTRARAKVMVASSAGGAAVLPPISIAMAIGDPDEVTDIQAALGADFPTGYTLSDSFSVLGDGYVTMVAADFSITYRAEAEGVSRVVYALEGEIAGVPDIKMGTLDYAVSDNLNSAPTADNFAYDKEVEINIPVEISVLDHIDAVDSDELQLIEVKSYTANVASLDPDSLTNKAFTFEAAEGGEHYVSYMVSDKRGGFATGIVKVKTFDAAQVARWTDIEHGTLLFSAPQTKVEIEDFGDAYQGFYGDTGYTPTLHLATFTFIGAQAYCGTRGRLPTPAEMDAMYAAKSPSTTWLWPIGKDYITQDVSTPGLISLTDGTVSALGTDLYYVTCVDSGGLAVTADKSVAVANGTDETTINVSFLRDTGPVADEILDINVTGSAIPSETTVTTDDNGEASFTVSSIKAETITVGVEYTNKSSELVPVGTDVTFIGDIDTARIESLTVIQDGAAPDGVSENTLSTLALDLYDNPVAGVLVDVNFDSATAALTEAPSTLLTGDDGVVEFNVTSSTPDTAGETVEVTVSYSSLLQGLTSQQAKVDFNGLVMCGTGVNDTSAYLSTDNCIKLVDTNQRLFALSPSLAAVKSQGFVLDNTGKRENSYGAVSSSGSGSFPYFVRAGATSSPSSVRREVDWCDRLTEIKFHGREWTVLRERDEDEFYKVVPWSKYGYAGINVSGGSQYVFGVPESPRDNTVNYLFQMYKTGSYNRFAYWSRSTDFASELVVCTAL